MPPEYIHVYIYTWILFEHHLKNPSNRLQTVIATDGNELVTVPASVALLFSA